MSNLPSVAVVILNWNGKYFLEKFLPSVFNSDYPNIEFIIGDNASTDSSVDFIRENYPAIKIIENSENLGFAGGYNKVLEQVDAEYFILLNSDVEVTTDWIIPVIEFLEYHKQYAVAQPKILSFHDKEKFEHAGASGGFIDRFGFPFCRGRIMDYTEVDSSQYQDPMSVFWATGAALFIRKQVWLQAGGFDSDFFAHMEEIDLCWRIQQLGYKIAVVPQSTVYHVGGGTLNTSNPHKTYLNFRNNLVMLQKNLPFFTACFVIGSRLWIDLFALIKFLLDGKFKDAWAVSRSHQYFFGNFFKNARKRKKLKRGTHISGVYRGSILVAFYFKKIRAFSKLNHKKIDF